MNTYEHVARGIDEEAGRSAQAAGDGELRAPTGGYLDNAVVAAVEDEQIARAIDCDSVWSLQASGGNCDRRTTASGDFEDLVISGIGEKDIACTVNRNTHFTQGQT
jgi:hypothetical protein